MKVIDYIPKKNLSKMSVSELTKLADIGRRFLNCITEDDIIWLDGQAIEHHMDFYRYLGCLVNAAHELYRDEHPRPWEDDPSTFDDLSDDELPF